METISNLARNLIQIPLLDAAQKTALKEKELDHIVSTTMTQQENKLILFQVNFQHKYLIA